MIAISFILWKRGARQRLATFANRRDLKRNNKLPKQLLQGRDSIKLTRVAKILQKGCSMGLTQLQAGSSRLNPK